MSLQTFVRGRNFEMWRLLMHHAYPVATGYLCKTSTLHCYRSHSRWESSANVMVTQRREVCEQAYVTFVVLCLALPSHLHFCCSSQPTCPVLHSIAVPFLVQWATLFVIASSMPVLCGIPLPCVQCHSCCSLVSPVLQSVAGEKISGVLVSCTPKVRGGKRLGVWNRCKYIHYSAKQLSKNAGCKNLGVRRHLVLPFLKLSNAHWVSFSRRA